MRDGPPPTPPYTKDVHGSRTIQDLLDDTKRELDDLHARMCAIVLGGHGHSDHSEVLRKYERAWHRAATLKQMAAEMQHGKADDERRDAV